ncbi:MAG: HipA N-terminal domain-containing protein [Marinobacter sp.]|uniref:HipA N-terminal domain-containing protein n=1 Tax=Marinobacter sp. TaxID=50741 RepID=UPI003F95DC21
MDNRRMDEMNVLKLTLHDRLVGYLAGFQNGRNVLSFAEEFTNDTNRPTFSLITHPAFSRAKALMEEPWARNQRLHPVLSNLLPEGALRELIAKGLKVHVDNEFHILSYLGGDLPGALIAEPMEPEQVPASVLSTHGKARAIEFKTASMANKFSLAGVQMKFSMKENYAVTTEWRSPCVLFLRWYYCLSSLRLRATPTGSWHGRPPPHRNAGWATSWLGW